MRKQEKERVVVSDVPNMHAGTFKKVEMVISPGKFEAMKNALLTYGDSCGSAVAQDLLGMLLRAE
jgi:hypothetical protein